MLEVLDPKIENASSPYQLNFHQWEVSMFWVKGRLEKLRKQTYL